MTRLKTPARVIANGAPSRIVGLTFSIKNGGAHLAFESLLESDYHLVLEHDPRVVGYQVQPRTDRFFVDGVLRTYTPDVQIALRVGATRLVEVKADGALARNRALAEVLAAAEAHYALEGIDFAVVFASEFRVGARISNLRALYRYADFGIDSRLDERARQLLGPFGRSSVAELAARLRDVGHLRAVYALLFRGRLHFPLDAAPISSTTELSWGPGW